jgi:hypothetical protein
MGTWDFIGKAALAGADVASKYNEYDSKKKQRQSSLDAIQAQLNQTKLEDQADFEYAQQMAGFNARNRAASASASAATEKNRRAAANSATTQYTKDQTKVKKTYDPYVQMLGRVTPQMEAMYSQGTQSLEELLTSAKADRKKKPIDLALINLGVK